MWYAWLVGSQADHPYDYYLHVPFFPPLSLRCDTFNQSHATRLVLSVPTAGAFCQPMPSHICMWLIKRMFLESIFHISGTRWTARELVLIVPLLLRFCWLLHAEAKVVLEAHGKYRSALFYDRIFDKSSSCEVRGILAHLKSTRGCYTSQRHRNSSSLSLVIMIGWSSERGKHFLTLSTGRSGKKKTKKQCFSLGSWRLYDSLIQGREFSFIVLAECREVGHLQWELSSVCVGMRAWQM